jgi:hypothetical protein
MPVKCGNCGGKHLATSSACPKQWKIEKQRAFGAAANKGDAGMAGPQRILVNKERAAAHDSSTVSVVIVNKPPNGQTTSRPAEPATPTQSTASTILAVISPEGAKKDMHDAEDLSDVDASHEASERDLFNYSPSC